MTQPTCPVVVAIGYNRGEKRMSQGAARSFKMLVRDAIEFVGGEVNASVHGLSAWKGQSEKSTVFFATIPVACVSDVQARLNRIGWNYDQDAIGFIVGLPATTSYITIEDPNHAEPHQ